MSYKIRVEHVRYEVGTFVDNMVPDDSRKPSLPKIFASRPTVYMSHDTSVVTKVTRGDP